MVKDVPSDDINCKKAERNLCGLFDPRSIALIGASTAPHKWGNHIARHLLRGAGRRRVYLVNPRGGTIDGVDTVKSLADISEVPECLLIVVAPEAAETAVMEGLRLGAKAFCVMTAGFGEISAEGKAAEERMAKAVRGAGAVLLGPNIVGFQDSAAELYATRIVYPEGPIGVVSQSGLVTHDLSRYAAAQKTGFSRALNLGNQADIGLADAVRSFDGHSATKALIVYCEDMRDGRCFLSAAAKVRASGIPVILLTVGASEAAARSALSHTGALVTPMDAVDAACKAAGILRVNSTREAIAVADALSKLGGAPSRSRVGIVTDGGGLGSLSSEQVSFSGLDMPVLSDALQTRLKDVSGPRVGTSNPVDLAGEADYETAVYARVVAEMLRSDELDAVLVSAYFGGYSAQDDDVARAEAEAAKAMADVAQDTGKPLILHTLYPDFATGDTLRDRGIPVQRDLDSAVHALHHVLTRPVPQTIPALPNAILDNPVPTDYWSTRNYFFDRGVCFPEGALVATESGVTETGTRLGFPLVMKAADLLHKSDEGGVKLGLANENEVKVAFLDLRHRFPKSKITLERQLPLDDGVELLIGARIDGHLGPLITIALGGVYTEILAQSATALAPVTHQQALELIQSLKGAAILNGARGRPPLDVDAAAAIAVAVAAAACEMRNHIDAVELNPVLVLPEGAFALDARIIPATGLASSAGGQTVT